jgi:hypothetical protein
LVCDHEVSFGDQLVHGCSRPIARASAFGVRGDHVVHFLDGHQAPGAAPKIRDRAEWTARRTLPRHLDDGVVAKVPAISGVVIGEVEEHQLTSDRNLAIDA